MNANRQQLLNALTEMSELYPEWRLGQMLCNISWWAKAPADAQASAEVMWDIEDDELLATVKDHVAQRRAQLQEDARPA
jgi:hypothetical protein